MIFHNLMKLKTAVLAPVLLCMHSSLFAAGVSSDPGDYKALPAGTNLAVAYYQHLKADNVYANDKKVVNDLGLTLDIGMLRYVKFIELGGLLMNPQVVLPLAKQRNSLEGSENSGIGDLLVGGVAWPYHNDQLGRYFALGGFISLPTGSHENDSFAISNDRFQYNFQTGYQHALNSNITFEGIAQIELYSDKDKSGMEKETFYQTDLSAIYKFTKETSMAVTWRRVDGGRELLGRETMLESEQKNTLLLSGATNIAKNTQLMLQWRQDFGVKDGVEMSGIQSRLVYAF